MHRINRTPRKYVTFKSPTIVQLKKPYVWLFAGSLCRSFAAELINKYGCLWDSDREAWAVTDAFLDDCDALGFDLITKTRYNALVFHAKRDSDFNYVVTNRVSNLKPEGPIECISMDTGLCTVYSSVEEAALATNIPEKSIILTLNGGAISTKGLYWTTADGV